MGFELNLNQVSLFIRLRGTVIQRIYFKVISFVVYVTSIVCLHFFVQPLGLTSSIIGVLGVIISLLLGFRTNSAHAKYDEARKVWATMKSTIRIIARTIWIFGPSTTAKELIAKKSVINLLDGFGHSVKHYLREEYSDKELDLEPIVKPIQKFENHPEKLPEKQNLTKIDPYLASTFQAPTNIPNEIIYQLSLYSRSVTENCPSSFLPMWSGVTAGINRLELALSELESLRRTPIPICYSAHLTQAFWIYLLIMPFQLLNTLGWWVIPALAITFFAFEGCLEMSHEMEDPLGYDVNDLPLDDYCWTIRKELALLTGNGLAPDFEKWTLSSENLPLQPYSQLTGNEWSDTSLEEARNILLNLNFDTNPELHNRAEWKSVSERKFSEEKNDIIKN